MTNGCGKCSRRAATLAITSILTMFECDLNPSEKIELETALSDIINHDEDQVIFCWTGAG